jgi:type IV fimbrial biogenesis protein FimT
MVLAITSVTLGLALPSFDHLRSHIHLRATTAQLETDLQLARSSAVALNRVVRVTFDEGPAGACYVMHTGGPLDCNCAAADRPICPEGTEVLRTALVPTSTGLSLRSNSRSIGFEPVGGMVTPTATISASSRLQERINVVINIMGRVRTCSPTAGLGGEPVC